MPPLISVIMPCHNRAHDLHDVLLGYAQQHAAPPFELLAIDDASTDNTLHILERFTQQLPLRIFRSQGGPATARNVGLANAQGEIIIFVGDDIRPASDFIAAHWQAHCVFGLPTQAILGKVVWAAAIPCNRVMTHIDGVGMQQFSYLHLKPYHEYDYRHFYTANISIKRSWLLNTHQQFDTDFTLAALEDAEFAYRLSCVGLKIWYVPTAVGEHYHYHNTWSFCRRQVNCGKMLPIFQRKHPNVFEKSLPRAVLKIINISRSAAHASRWQCKHPATYWLNWAMQMGSQLEWGNHPLADDLYSALFLHQFLAGAVVETSDITPFWHNFTERTFEPLHIAFNSN